MTGQTEVVAPVLVCGEEYDVGLLVCHDRTFLLVVVPSRNSEPVREDADSADQDMEEIQPLVSVQ